MSTYKSTSAWQWGRPIWGRGLFELSQYPNWLCKLVHTILQTHSPPLPTTVQNWISNSENSLTHRTSNTMKINFQYQTVLSTQWTIFELYLAKVPTNSSSFSESKWISTSLTSGKDDPLNKPDASSFHAICSSQEQTERKDFTMLLLGQDCSIHVQHTLHSTSSLMQRGIQRLEHDWPSTPTETYQ